eukprot:scaffold2314_cov267-Pinguiococcus_pyrenoidosus.AAC.13
MLFMPCSTRQAHLRRIKQNVSQDTEEKSDSRLSPCSHLLFCRGSARAEKDAVASRWEDSRDSSDAKASATMTFIMARLPDMAEPKPLECCLCADEPILAPHFEGLCGTSGEARLRRNVRAHGSAVVSSTLRKRRALLSSAAAAKVGAAMTGCRSDSPTPALRQPPRWVFSPQGGYPTCKRKR